MGHFATGVTVVTTRDENGRPLGLTANAVASVSLQPPMVLVCVDRQSESHDAFAASEAFAVNVLTQMQETLSRRFAKSGGDKEAQRIVAVLDKLQPVLNEAKPARSVALSKEEQVVVRPLFLLTAKPTMYVANVSESGFDNNPMLDRVKALAPQHPEWRSKLPYKAILEGDMKALAATGEKGVAEVVMATHAGMTTDEFARIVSDWIATAVHPRFKRPYTELVYKPMLELLAYLRDNGFKTYIVSGGGIEFLRVFAERIYGIPPEQVVGSTIVTTFRSENGKPVLVREAKLDFIDDKAGKPVAINRFIGRRPVLAFGNSDGDLQMLQWTMGGSGPRFSGLVHHNDADREFAYDRNSAIGRLDKALDEAVAKRWMVVDMKRDWRVVYP